MAMTPDDVLKLVKDKEVKFVDFRFTDTRGKEQHVTVPVKYFTKEKFEEGHAFDGSSIAGWKGIQASDMLLMPDASSARMDPFSDEFSEEEAAAARRRRAEKIPSWAKGEVLEAAVQRQQVTDPDRVFGLGASTATTCNLQAIFSKQKQRFRKRNSSANWSRDELTLKEKGVYKMQMGLQ
jgi:glutamine synthetase